LRASAYAYKTLNRAIGKAIGDYGMIRDGDRILVGLSGGADSLTLLWMLAERRHRIRIRYDLTAAHLDLFSQNGAADVLKSFCDSLEIALRMERTDIGVVSHSSVNRENPCFLCARLRRKRLFEIADELDCNKLALGHNKDDVIETLFLNMFYSGEISTMLPAQELFGGRFNVIRPLAYSEEALIRRFARDQDLPVVENRCPTSGRSMRTNVKILLGNLYRSNPKIKGNIFRAMRRVKTEYLPK